MRNRLHVKVGIFISAGILLFIGAVLALGRAQNVLSRSYTYYVTTSDAEGLLRGATVMLAGVQVGTVTGFELKPGRNPVRIAISIGSKYSEFIRAGTVARISTVGVVGEQIIALTPAESPAPLISPGQEIPVRRVPNLAQVATNADKLVLKLNGIADKLDRILDPSKVTQLFDGLNRVVTKVDRGSGTLSALLNDPELYDNAKALFGEANENRIVRNLVRRSVENAEKHQQAGTVPPKSGSK